MSPALWQALLVNFLFWTGLAIGAVVFAALLELTDAAWAQPLRPIAERLRWFLPISLAIYIGAFAAARAFAWRDLLVLALPYAAAFWFCQVARLRTAIVLLVVYAIAFSVIAIDVVMSLEPGWVSTLFPAYFFTANVYGGIAAVAVVAAFAVPREMFDTSLARDLRSVLLGFALFWMYFTWTQFLVIWYGNLPTDTGYVIGRLADDCVDRVRVAMRIAGRGAAYARREETHAARGRCRRDRRRFLDRMLAARCARCGRAGGAAAYGCRDCGLRRALCRVIRMASVTPARTSSAPAIRDSGSCAAE